MSTNGGFPLGVGVSAQGDAEVGPLDILAGLNFSIRNMADEIKRENERRDRMAQHIPGDPVHSGAGTSPSSGSFAFDLCGGVSPSPGHVWQVRRIVIGGSLVTSTVTGTAYIYRQAQPPSAGNIVNLVDTASSFPDVAFYGTHQFICRPGDHIWAFVINPTANVQYSASVQIEDWEEECFFSSYSE